MAQEPGRPPPLDLAPAPPLLDWDRLDLTAGSGYEKRRRIGGGQPRRQLMAVVSPKQLAQLKPAIAQAIAQAIPIRRGGGVVVGVG